MHSHFCKLMSFILSAAFLTGCTRGVAVESPDGAKDEGSILKQTTQDVRQFDKDAEQVDNDVKVSNPITGPLEALGPMRNQVAQLGIEYHVNMFNALNGRYPKDHAEFMEKIIKGNNVKLPKLPYHSEYQYDVENHKLVVVKKPDAQ